MGIREFAGSSVAGRLVSGITPTSKSNGAQPCLRARTRDLSSNGMFIESLDPLWVGAGFTAQLTLDPPLRVNCFVKRVEPGRGMGVSVALAEGQHQQQLSGVHQLAFRNSSRKSALTSRYAF